MGLAFTELQVGPVTLPNRFIRAGANEMMTVGCAPSASLLRLHERLAAGGTGMTTLAYVAVTPDGRTFEEQGVISVETLADYRAIADAVHAKGAKISAQITHAGSFVQHKTLSTRRAMSADGGVDKVGLTVGRLFQHQMDRANMDQVIGEFVTAAKLCRDAGFDAVELHMGHGYLLNQFISPLSNHRHDDFGGSAENRVRFPAEVAAAVKAEVGRDMAILAKINLYDGVKNGGTVEDAIVTAIALEAAGVDMLVLSGGRNIESSWALFNSPLPYADLRKINPGLGARLQFALLEAATPKSVQFRELYFLEAARKVRAQVSCQLAYVGGVLGREAAEAVLGEGFDAIVMARALVHEPELVNRLAEDPTARSSCTSCNRCIATMYTPTGLFCPLVENGFAAELNRVPARIA
jgi:2,4-dienoyl-CoA reductase-like NADH-dependent reductase (Old Yellow Enzyme family)